MNTPMLFVPACIDTSTPHAFVLPSQTAVAQGGSRAYQANGMAGRYVYVRLLGKQYLTLCEVQVMSGDRLTFSF